MEDEIAVAAHLVVVKALACARLDAEPWWRKGILLQPKVHMFRLLACTFNLTIFQAIFDDKSVHRCRPRILLHTAILL
jgi:hypothetical protein